jgi:SAM-dependent methyltransferase
LIVAQNIYDTRTFFEGYSRLRRSTEGLDGAGEWPAIQALLPDLQGKSVVDLGCGFGWFVRWARAHGAAYVQGFDLSENMLARARAMTADSGAADPGVEYTVADLEHLVLPKASFDLAYSSLTFHYIVDFARLARMVLRALRPGSHFVFTIEHPIYMASAQPGWMLTEDGQKTWPIDGYSREGQRVTDWLAKGVVKQHRTIGTTINALLAAGFALRNVTEWHPTAEQIAATPAWDEEMERPMILIISAQR